LYLIDTSIWIDYFREIENSPVKQFNSILEKNLPFGITGVIFQEILQGAATTRDFQQLKDYLITQRFFHPQDNIVSFESAANLFYSCRRKGITIRSTIDCLIAQVAIENDLILLHNDQDYLRLKSVFPKLKLAN
jgi:predicted nucleic acid-binding protein